MELLSCAVGRRRSAVDEWRLDWPPPTINWACHPATCQVGRLCWSPATIIASPGAPPLSIDDDRVGACDDQVVGLNSNVATSDDEVATCRTSSVRRRRSIGRLRRSSGRLRRSGDRRHALAAWPGRRPAAQVASFQPLQHPDHCPAYLSHCAGAPGARKAPQCRLPGAPKRSGQSPPSRQCAKELALETVAERQLHLVVGVDVGGVREREVRGHHELRPRAGRSDH